jgi:hypothetical protein
MIAGGYVILVHRTVAGVIEWESSGDRPEHEAIAIGPFDTVQAATDYAATAEQPARVSIVPLLRPIAPL